MAAMTISQKILAAHAGLEHVQSGDTISIELDMMLGNDITAPPSIKQLDTLGLKPAFPERIALVPDHFTPNRDIQTAENCLALRDFNTRYPATHYFELGEAGIEHVLLPEYGLALPGQAIVGGDSHTCTYGGLGAFSTGVGSTDLTAAFALGKTWFKVPPTLKVSCTGTPSPWAGGKDLVLRIIGAIGTDGALGHSLEMDGEAIEKLGLEDRLTMANMAVEAGAVNGIIAPSEAVLATMRECAQNPFTPAYSDPDALYERHITLDVSAMPPQVAMPFSPGDVVGVDEVPMVRVDQVVIGSCTNGRISDLRNAARVLAGNKVAKGLRLLITPASPAVYNQALSEGLIAIFMRSGAVIMPPGCGVCFGGHMGVLGPGEVCVSTTNRNFKGRMGHVQSRVYLASPAVAAASAVRGIICHPEDVLGG